MMDMHPIQDAWLTFRLISHLAQMHLLNFSSTINRTFGVNREKMLLHVAFGSKILDDNKPNITKKVLKSELTLFQTSLILLTFILLNVSEILWG